MIIPTYNRSALLRETLNSVMAQSYRDFDVVVVDDGSSDDTRQVVAQFGKPVLYVHQGNRGRSSARNLGVQASSGKYLMFLDSDDMLLPSSLEALVSALEADPTCGLAYSDGYYCDEIGTVLEAFSGCTQLRTQDLLETLALRNVVITPAAALVRRDSLNSLQYPYFDESLSAGEDQDLWLRLAAGGCNFKFVDTLTCKYRLHSRNGIQSQSTNVDQLLLSHYHYYGERYTQCRLKLFHSDTFLRLSSSTQTTFLYCLLLHPIYGDPALHDTVLGSDRFNDLPSNVKSQILYLVAIDDLLHGKVVELVGDRLARAVALSPRCLKYRLGYWAASIAPTALRVLIPALRRVRGLRISSSVPFHRIRSAVGQQAKGTV